MRRLYLRARSGRATAASLGLWLTIAAANACLAQEAATARRFGFEIIAGRLVSGDKTVRVTKGDTVELRWTSDRPVELHLHGYDIQLRAGPDSPQVMRFHAHATGRFPLELHGSSGRHATLIYVEVHPR